MEVETKSAWLSKINWVQVVGVMATAGTAFGIDLPKEDLLNTVVGIQAAVGVVTWVMRTWFTTKLTPSSAAKA
jgi:uncharacterized membrane protein